jgi:hypothetical protein
VKRKLSGPIVKTLSYDLQSGSQSIHCAVFQFQIQFTPERLL